ncbi:uncharacterized protein BP5553_10152 [Venustampulla echinocandica]|uniref:NACHT domain-containing protein n=1 Tax=Venustampulla echinocandica TaxID=2656787 RepID=A0A370TAG1_9HELO|nr:uncharacterized protein BP5553_10152 [Venustampulla echinocandica]RDL30807.1 hypothetical protein BP5553_10152 [Venustampulla echinocandica]
MTGEFHIHHNLENELPDREMEIKCHQTFRTSEYERYKERNPNPVKDTCHWFLRHTRYTAWKSSPMSSLLWVSADPGCGKSIFFKFLTDEKPEFLRHAIGVFEKNGDYIKENVELLWDILTAASADPEIGEIVCILDALDECRDSELKILLQKLCLFYQDPLHPSSTTNLKFLVTSRSLLNIERKFNRLSLKIPEIRLAGEDETDRARDEIILAIEDELVKIQQELQLSQESISDLRKEISKVKHRTYLWLKLIFELTRKDPQSVTKIGRRKIIDALPESVDADYIAILDKIPENDEEQARKLLSIVCAARRPLSVKEMSIALTIRADNISHRELDIQAEDYPKRLIKNICGFFVTVIDGRVYLLHPSKI